MSVTDPVGGMHSLFRGVLPEHVFAPRPPGGVDLAPDDPELRGLGAGDAGAVRRARRRGGRRHRRAGAPGRRGHARLQPARPGGAPRARPRARGARHPRRDRHRVPPHRPALGRATGWAALGRLAGHPLRGQGPDRWLPHARGGAVHPRGGRGRQPRRGRRAHARPHVHGQPAGLRRRRGQPRPARLTRHRGRGGAPRARAGRGPRARGIPARPSRRCACSAPWASCSCASRCAWRR